MNLEQELNEIKSKLDYLYAEREYSSRSETYFRENLNFLTRTIHGPKISHTLSGIYMAVCMDTRDPWKMGRILIFCPMLHKTTNSEHLTPDNLSWAMPCSMFGGIDETGAVFIPPEGSYVLIAFEGGDREYPFYIGTTWAPKRETNTNDPYACNPERERYRYLNPQGGLPKRQNDIRIGDPNHLLPPWNNESYYGEDNVMIQSGVSSPRSFDIPHMYGIKTPEKHFLLFDDGSYEREKKLYGKRLVLQSSKGNVIFMKDDCHSTIDDILNNKYFDTYNDKFSLPGNDNTFQKSVSKHKVVLDQTGIQIQSFGGARIILDDKLEGNIDGFENGWDSTYPPSRAKSRAFLRLESISGHRVTLSDYVGDNLYNGLFLNSVNGNIIYIIDKTKDNKAHKDSGILLQSASGNRIFLKDSGATLPERNGAEYRNNPHPKPNYNRDEDIYDGIPDTYGDIDNDGGLIIESASGQSISLSNNGAQIGDQNNNISMQNGSFKVKSANDHIVNTGKTHEITAQNCAEIVNENKISQVGGDSLDINRGSSVKYVEKDCVLRCETGTIVNYALNSIIQMSYTSPNVILGGVDPKPKTNDAGEEETQVKDPPRPVLLYDPNGQLLPSTPAKWLIAN